jgi:hypothetical protein
VSDFVTAWTQVEHALSDRDWPLTRVLELDLELDAGSIEPLLTRVDDEDLRIVFAAGLALARIDRADAIVPRLVPRLSDAHPLVAEHTRWILRELGAPALPLLMDAYASQPAHQLAIATALGWQGPRAEAAAKVLTLDAARDAAIAAAHRAIVGPWPDAPEFPLPYLGESIRMDDGGPPPFDAHGIEIWLDALQWQAYLDDGALWNRGGRPELEVHSWRPDQIAIAAADVVVGIWNEDHIVPAMLRAADGARFTNQELLWKVRDAHHRIAPTNDRIYEGLRRRDDGSYYIATGS